MPLWRKMTKRVIPYKDVPIYLGREKRPSRCVIVLINEDASLIKLGPRSRKGGTLVDHLRERATFRNRYMETIPPFLYPTVEGNYGDSIPFFHWKFSQLRIRAENECKILPKARVICKNNDILFERSNPKIVSLRCVIFVPTFLLASFEILGRTLLDCLQLSRQRERGKKNYQLGNTILVQTGTALPRLAYYARS